MKSKNNKSIRLIQGDCLQEMDKLIAEGVKVDLIVVDPPYNIGKAEWDKIENYTEWMGNVFKKCERLLKSNGSFYFFHNDFLKIVELQNWLTKNSSFIFKQFIVWDKRFENGRLKGYLDGHVAVKGLRNYKQMAEYCLFYTFQDETGLTTIMLDTNNFSTLRGYFKMLQEYIGLSIKGINLKLGHRKSEHCFYWKTTQWDMPTEKTYEELIENFGIDIYKGFREYESLRQEYESLRYTFNNQKTHHSVWQYSIAPKIGHVTPKPVDLLENIVKHSSNEGDTVLDCFMGSGTTGVACRNLNRDFIGIELDENYFKIAEERIHNAEKPIKNYSLGFTDNTMEAP